jgi:hypothetical protein
MCREGNCGGQTDPLAVWSEARKHSPILRVGPVILIVYSFNSIFSGINPKRVSLFGSRRSYFFLTVR